MPLPARPLCPAFLNRFRFDARVWCVAVDDLLLDLALQQAFDFAQQLLFIDANERYGVTFLTRTGRTPDSMHIVFRHVWQFVVNNVR